MLAGCPNLVTSQLQERKVPGEGFYTWGSQGYRRPRPHLLHVVAGLRTGLDEHNTQFFGPLLPFLDGYLPGSEGGMDGKISWQSGNPGRSEGGGLR